MKRLLIILFVFAASLSSIAQTTPESGYSSIKGTGFIYKRMGFDSVAMIPLSNSPHNPYRAGGLRFDSSNRKLQFFYAGAWNDYGKAVQLSDSSFKVGTDTIIIRGTGGGGSSVWGLITGTLSAQTDLQSALNAKVPTSRTISINGTTLDLSANRAWSVGTVTSVGTGYGLLGGPVTSSGNILVDSATLSSYYLRRKDSVDKYVTPSKLSDSIAAHPPLILDTVNYLAGSTVDTITLAILVSKTPLLVVSNPYTLHIATSYPPAADEVWINTATGGIKFGTSINSGQTVTALYKYYAVTPFSSVITDLEYIVAASGGTINNGNTTFTIPALINKRVRFYRNQLPQPSTNYSFNSSIGQFTLVSAATTGELFQLQTY